MARRRESLFDTLLVLPWWVAIGLGVFGYAAIRQGGIDDIRALSWRQFESIVGEAFRRRGYSVVENAVGGPDGGIDLVLRKDGQKHVVQCKQWKQWTVGVKPVRELAGVMAAADVARGFFVTSGRYTKEARRFASSVDIELIDGAALIEMVQSVQGKQPHIQPTTSGIGATTTRSNGIDVPSCPSCGSEMVHRTAKRGVNAGSQFWGCPRYPSCHGTREI